ncbi:MAG: Slp family lipoprotein [Thermodesulfobacteriota bacterium]
MNKSTKKYLLPLLILFILISGCAPVISRPVLNEVDKRLTFAEIKKDPSAHGKAIALLGGKVIKVTNIKDGTLVEVLQSPLARNLKPLPEKRSEGRFLIHFKGFIDPLVYMDKLITVAGQLTDPLTRPINRRDYTYPVIKVKEHYLWRMGHDNSPPVSFGIGLGLSGGF